MEINKDYKSAVSAWEFGKSRSSYHFRTDIIDPRWDTVNGLGKFDGDWSAELEKAITEAKPVSVHNRRNTFETRPEHTSVKLNTAEVADIQNIGGDDQRTIFRINHELGPTLRKMVDMTGVGDDESRLHIQFPTECFIGHIDRFDLNWPNEKPENLIRIGIMLTDWQQGHFFQFGNYPYQQWRAGDIHTFEYLHVPHYTANCGLTPRVTLFITGIITDKTREFLTMSKHVPSIKI
jgi:hypothetical protein